MNEMTRRRLLRAAQGAKILARDLHAQVELPASFPGVKQLLNESPKLKFIKRKHAHVLTERHKTARAKWCAEICHLSDEDWTRTIFWDARSLIWMDQMDSKAIGTT